jgi:hypothetical protein
MRSKNGAPTSFFAHKHEGIIMSGLYSYLRTTPVNYTSAAWTKCSEFLTLSRDTSLDCEVAYALARHGNIYDGDGE